MVVAVVTVFSWARRYDDDNQEDNQLDDEVLTSSTDEEGNHRPHPRRRSGGNHRRGGAAGGRVATAGSSSDEELASRHQGKRYERAGLPEEDEEDEDEDAWEEPARKRSSKLGGAGRKGPEQDDSWALFPGSEAALRAAAAEQQRVSVEPRERRRLPALPAPARC